MLDLDHSERYNPQYDYVKEGFVVLNLKLKNKVNKVNKHQI